MIINDLLDKLHASDAFKKWKKEHEGYFLAHFFKMLDKENEESWQIGYCNPDGFAIMTFLVAGDDISTMEESKPFKKPDAIIQELNMEAVHIDWEEAMATAVAKQKKDYPKELPMKVFFILQNIDKEIVYNITFFTQTFKALNIRVHSESGEIIKEDLNQFFSSMDGQKDQ